jgi:nitrogen fixation protein FixH
MKLHFGHGILLIMIAFMSGIFYLVYKTGQQRIDLVSRNYYEQELKYDTQIEKERKTNLLNEEVRINYDSEKKMISVQFPSKNTHLQLSGTLTFYKPDNAALDHTEVISPDKNNLQTIATNNLANGLWKIKVNWEAGNEAYYNEEKILVTN